MIQNIRYISSNGEIMREQNKSFSDAMNEEGYRIPSHKTGSRMFAGVQFPDSMTDSDIGKMARLSNMPLICEPAKN